jgi:cbb3-type cytochrome oxidase maturation protein
MSVIIILIAASLIIAIGFLIAFIWSVKNGQYDDDYTPSVRILFDDAPNVEKSEKSIKTEHTNQTKTKQTNL